MTLEVDAFFTPVEENKQNIEIEEDSFFTPVKKVSRTRSLLSAFPKGVIKGGSTLSPFPSTGPVPQELGERLTEEFLPTQEELPEELLERAGKIAPFLAGGTQGLIAKAGRAALASLLGQATKELGGGEMAQGIAELGALSLPSLSKTIPAKSAQKPIVDLLRKRGFSEKEIAPLLQSPKKLERFSRFASKGEKTNRLMRDIYEKFDNLYGSIRERGTELPGLNLDQAQKFEGDFNKILDRIPKFYRRQINEEVQDLLNSEMKFSDFVDFDQAVNARIKGVKGGKAWLGTLKEATSDAKQMIDKDLADEMKLTNQLYQKRANVSKHLTGKNIDDLIYFGEAGALVAGIADQNFNLIKNVLGVATGRKLAQEILINPKLQNISLRMAEAAKKNNTALTFKLQKIFTNELRKKDKELAEEVAAFSFTQEENQK